MDVRGVSEPNHDAWAPTARAANKIMEGFMVIDKEKRVVHET